MTVLAHAQCVRSDGVHFLCGATVGTLEEGTLSGENSGQIRSLFGHKSAITCIDVCARAECVVTGGEDSEVVVWSS
jgi:hypothetical protein